MVVTRIRAHSGAVMDEGHLRQRLELLAHLGRALTMSCVSPIIAAAQALTAMALATLICRSVSYASGSLGTAVSLPASTARGVLPMEELAIAALPRRGLQQSPASLGERYIRKSLAGALYRRSPMA